MINENQTGKCPDEQDLLLVLSGECSDALQTDVEAHFAECSECVKRLEQLSLRGAEFIAQHIGESQAVAPRLLDTENNLADTVAMEMPPLSKESVTAAVPDIPGYEILEPVARGGMGVIYRARAIELQRQVAIKMIIGGLWAGPERIHRFAQESRALAKLDHPHIVRIHQVDATQGQPYFVMEFVEGPNLQSQLDGTPWQPERAAQFVARLADAVSLAHDQAIIHRDLKPANILIDRQKSQPDFPRIIDFGLAKDFDSVDFTKSGDIFGSPAYMSPEQASGDSMQVGTGTDIFSLGCILYELLTGRPPFNGSTVPETLQRIVNDDPVHPRLLNSNIPKDLETICLKCIEKKVGKRYLTASALAADCSNFLANRPILARPISWFERSWKLASRHPAWATAAVVFLVAISSLLGMWVKFTSDLAIQTQLALSQKEVALEKEELANKNARLARNNEELAKRNEEDAIRNFRRAEEQIQIQEYTYLFTTTLISNLKKLNQNQELVKIVLDSEKEFDNELQGEPLMKAAYLSAVATTLSDIAAPELALEKIEQALRLFRKLDPDSIQYSRALMVKMMILYNLDSIGNVREVRDLLKSEDLEIHDKDRRLLDLIDSQLLVMDQKNREAEKSLQRFLDLADSDFADARKYRGRAYGLMGIVKVRLNQIDEATRYFKLHLDMAGESDGSNSDVFIRAQNRLAFALMKSGKLEDAAFLFQQALDRCLERFGEQNFTTLEVMINSARVNFLAEKYDVAIRLNKQAAKAAMKKYGQRHQFTLTAMCQLAVSSLENESQADALSFLLEIVNQQELKKRSDYFSVSLMTLMARLFLDTGDFANSSEFTQLAGKRVRSRFFRTRDKNILKSIEKLERKLAQLAGSRDEKAAPENHQPD